MQKLIFIIAFLCAPVVAQAWPGDVLAVHDGDTVRVHQKIKEGNKERIQVFEGVVIRTDNKGQHYTATDAEEMIGKLTGMPIPLNSLRQWILGLPGDATDYKLDDQYRLSEVNYSKDGKNWKVVYSAYDSKTQPAMPANMELSDGDQRIKLKMDNWIVK